MISKYCSITDQYSESEEMMNENSLRMKDAYRRKIGLLTSHEMKNIRKKKGLSQFDLAKALGENINTIEQYENHKIQSTAYDNILRKVNEEPDYLNNIFG
jgi:putative zinc finger/helix-turn-helix YgiT family protein